MAAQPRPKRTRFASARSSAAAWISPRTAHVTAAMNARTNATCSRTSSRWCASAKRRSESRRLTTRFFLVEQTLPYGWYSDPEILRREQERIFRSAWQYVGHTGELASPGYFAAQAGRAPVVVTRARDGVLRAFLNVCRHRGFPVADGSGSRETLQCPYHAWTYGLDGCLRAAPRSEEEPHFPQDELGLVPVAVDTWGPFVFVSLAAEPEPLTDA